MWHRARGIQITQIISLSFASYEFSLFRESLSVIFYLINLISLHSIIRTFVPLKLHCRPLYCSHHVHVLTNLTIDSLIVHFIYISSYNRVVLRCFNYFIYFFSVKYRPAYKAWPDALSLMRASVAISKLIYWNWNVNESKKLAFGDQMVASISPTNQHFMKRMQEISH